MTKYRRLTRVDRCHIEKALSFGKRVSRVADELGLHRSSVYREIRRGTIRKGVLAGKRCGEYSAREAQRRAISTYHDSRLTPYYRGYKIKGWIEDQIILKLHARWSPEQISHRLFIDQRISISAEAIYKYILSMKKRGGELHKLLRHYGRRAKRATHRSRYWNHQKCRRRTIEDRPQEADDRSQSGHLERDLMLGKRGTGAVLAIVDRKSRMTFLKKLNSTDCRETNLKTNELIQQSRIDCRSITNDNGHEFGQFWILEQLLDAKVYFTHPLSPWERGTVENTIGLVRQFIPKGTDLRQITDKNLEQIETLLNWRPRKTLGYRTPMELDAGEIKKLVLKKKIEPLPAEYYEQFY